MRDFRKLATWEKGHALALAIYKATADFPLEERYGLTSQIRRAGVSIPSNIAEGSGHESDSQFARYLQLAAGSASEVQYQIILAKDLGYLGADTHAELSTMADEVKRMLNGFLGKLQPKRSG